MADAQIDGELAEACRLDAPYAVDKLGLGAGEGEGADELRRDDGVLLGTQEHQMAAMVGQVARVFRRVAAIDLAVFVEERLELRRQPEAERAELRLLGEIVEHHGRRGSGLGAGARAVRRLTLLEHAAIAESGGVKLVARPAGDLPGLLHRAERGDRALRIAAAHPASTELRGESAAFRPECQEMNRDRIVDIDQLQPVSY